jgi:hypothetical protein
MLHGVHPGASLSALRESAHPTQTRVSFSVNCHLRQLVRQRHLTVRR